MSDLNWELQAYGASKADILESIEDSITFRMSGVDMVIASYLSNAQEEIEYGMKDQARKSINIAKMLIFERMDAKGAE